MITEIHTSAFDGSPLVGEAASGESSGSVGGRPYRTKWWDFTGVAASEWTGEPVHTFRDGIIGTTPQEHFAIPVSRFPLPARAELPDADKAVFAQASAAMDDCDVCWYLSSDDVMTDAELVRRLRVHFASGHTDDGGGGSPATADAPAVACGIDGCTCHLSDAAANAEYPGSRVNGWSFDPTREIWFAQTGPSNWAEVAGTLDNPPSFRPLAQLAPEDVREQDARDHQHDEPCPRCGRRQWSEEDSMTCLECLFVSCDPAPIHHDGTGRVLPAGVIVDVITLTGTADADGQWLRVRHPLGAHLGEFRDVGQLAETLGITVAIMEEVER